MNNLSKIYCISGNSGSRQKVFALLMTTLLLLIILINDNGMVHGQETTGNANTDTDSFASDASPSMTTEEGSPPVSDKPPKDTSFNVSDHFDWGSYYDPKNIFCGQYDCYKILGFDYESYTDGSKPDTKIITKRYRALSREWHPDKSKHKNAKEKFVKIARAYEVLTDSKLRKEYDELRYNQELYFQKYGSNVLWQYAPKSDTLVVVMFVLLFINGFGYLAQRQRWKNVADRLIRAATEDWTPAQGGTKESKELRGHAIEILQEKEKENDKEASTNGSTTSSSTSPDKSTKSNKGKKGPKKLSAKEKKQKETEDLMPIIKDLVYEIHDFGAGFHKPTWKDLIMWKILIFPYHMTKVIIWQMKYYIRRIRKLPLSEEEKAILTERAVGHVSWEIASEEEKQEMMNRELWILDNLVEYKEEQEFKKLSKGEQKYYQRMKKKKVGGGGIPPDFKED